MNPMNYAERAQRAEDLLNGEIPVIYPIGSWIPLSEVEMLSRYTQAKVMALFEKAKDGGTTEFTLELRCHNCQCVRDYTLSKSKVMEAIIEARESPSTNAKRSAYKRKTICQNCAQEEKRKLLDSQSRRKEEEEISISNRTEDFIDKVLNPNRKWITPAKDWWNNLASAIQWTKEDEIYEVIRSIPYQEFLKTPYWAAIANRIKYRAKFKCQMCNDGGLLHVHHRSYENHGAEHDHLEDLICVCAECHRRHHFEDFACAVSA